jgi:bifunctional non-homologous end joining protein LigD
LKASLSDLIEALKAQNFEGLVAKRRNSRYEPGKRSGAWRKMSVNRRQDFVIGGYTAGGATFDAVIFGYYEGRRLMYAARTRNGFTPALLTIGKNNEIGSGNKSPANATIVIHETRPIVF